MHHAFDELYAFEMFRFLAEITQTIPKGSTEASGSKRTKITCKILMEKAQGRDVGF